jgi:hypothetical protein
MQALPFTAFIQALAACPREAAVMPCIASKYHMGGGGVNPLSLAPYTGFSKPRKHVNFLNHGLTDFWTAMSDFWTFGCQTSEQSESPFVCLCGGLKGLQFNLSQIRFTAVVIARAMLPKQSGKNQMKITVRVAEGLRYSVKVLRNTVSSLRNTVRVLRNTASSLRNTVRVLRNTLRVLRSTVRLLRNYEFKKQIKKIYTHEKKRLCAASWANIKNQHGPWSEIVNAIIP